MENKYKKQTEEKPVKEKKKVVKSLTSLVTGRFLTKEYVLNNIPFLLFLTFLGVCYIANGYYAEKTVKEIYEINSELKELRSEYITIKSELNYRSKQSQVARAIKSQGIEESIIPPHKIVVNKEELENLRAEIE